MTLIMEYRTSARPDRCVIEVYDADAYEGDAEAWDRAETEVVAGNGYHLYLRTLQSDLRVEVAIRVWDAPQVPPEGVEGWIGISLESETSELVVNQLTSGPVGTTRLPRPGVYAGHAWWTGRQAAADYYDQNIRGGSRQFDTVEDVRRVLELSPVVERYTLDLWFLRESVPEDEEA
ncbi:hypothetical protein [Streptomyces sp. NPDC088794]|uniref:hypothetical protein n=1 Tax=Streptomyces sp. NPDC088794 TaxID=3365902 RepID=UPI0037FBC270